MKPAKRVVKARLFVYKTDISTSNASSVKVSDFVNSFSVSQICSSLFLYIKMGHVFYEHSII